MVDYTSAEEEATDEKNAMADALIEATDLEYISKSRVKKWKTCPRSFYYTYVMEKRFDGNFYTRRGTRVHKAIELYYEEVEKAIREGGFDPDDLMSYFPTEKVGVWLDFVHPFLTNFLKFERRRWEATQKYVDEVHGAPNPDDFDYYVHEFFTPHSVELEGNLEDPPVEGSPPWLGYADVVLHAASVPDVPDNEGYVIVDHKTGKVPDEKYRDEGIFLEGTFYRMLFERHLDVRAVAGYYPKEDVLITSPVSEERQEEVERIVREMITTESLEDYPLEEQPLCCYSDDKDGRCDHYEYCSTRWGRGTGPNYKQY